MAKNKKVEYKTLLAVLANGSTDDAQKLLKKYSGRLAKSKDELEYRLAKIYADSPNKIDIERDFAEIHPHKEFILKYLAPSATIEPVKINGIDGESSDAEGHPPCGNPNCPYCKRYLNANGNKYDPSSKTSNACGCSGLDGDSNADGDSKQTISQQTIATIGVVAIVALFGIAIFNNTK